MSTRHTDDLYQPGDVIGNKYEVHRRLGKGGFGLVYLVYDRDTKGVYALKTFRDELLADAGAREMFKKEALLWLNLEEHPFILPARWVDEVSGRLFVATDYVAPDEQGRVNLVDHLAHARGPMETDRMLEWAIQFCLGMEHANAHGIKAHRDIKPANILIGQDGTSKIADFGLAAAAEMIWQCGSAAGESRVIAGEGFPMSLLEMEGRKVCGTPGYIPPEVYEEKGADARSDIYSFGLVLWQMAAGSPFPPFHVNVQYRGNDAAYAWEYQKAVYGQQKAGRIPPVDSPIREVIGRCLKAEPSQRYSSFAELRADLEPVLRKRTGRTVTVPTTGERSAAFWNNKGVSLDYLGRNEEAIGCFDQALAINPKFAATWNNKGNSLNSMGHYQEAIGCFDQALDIDPKFAAAWNNKGNSLGYLSRSEEAIGCFDQALAIDPRHAGAWNNKCNSLNSLGRYEEALGCSDQALAMDPKFAMAWTNKGNSLNALGRYKEAIGCYDRALDINPQEATALYNKGVSLNSLGRYKEAIGCYNKAIAIDPRNANAWTNKGNSLNSLGQYKEAIGCYDQALAIDPRLAPAWYNKGANLQALDRHEEAIAYYDRALEINPKYAEAWHNKGSSLQALGRYEEAIGCFDQVLGIDPRLASSWYNKGSSLGSLGRYKEAIGCFDQALAIDPRYVMALYNKGVSLHFLGRYEESLDCYDKALAIDPRYAAAWFFKAFSQETLGLRNEARQSYRTFIELAPSQEVAQIELARQRLKELQ
ncbi:MAG: tetratricopeptide repeat protein [Verrucomicrobia bacterium]|nr:tetratricopeptide repeat protein [Verrucomicrobiota bacterium]